MKILITTGIFPPDIGGPASYVPRIADALVRNGHTVKVICLADDPRRESSHSTFSIKRIERGTNKLWRGLVIASNVVAASRECDVIFANGLFLETWVGSLIHRVPVVAKLVGDPAWERARNRGWFRGTIDEYQRSPKGLLLRIVDWMRTYPLLRFRKIIVPSVYLRGIVSGWHACLPEIHVIYNAVAPVEVKATLRDPIECFRVVTVCRLVGWKGLADLIEVVAHRDHLRLVIVGDGPERAILERQVERSGCESRVQFAGTLCHDDTLAQIRGSDVFVLNSSYEGLPHVVLEAMECGVPVIATKVGGTPELVIDGETGILVPVRDVQALADGLERCRSDAALRRRLVEGGFRRLVARFTFDTLLHGTEAVLRSEARSLKAKC